MLKGANSMEIAFSLFLRPAQCMHRGLHPQELEIPAVARTQHSAHTTHTQTVPIVMSMIALCACSVSLFQVHAQKRYMYVAVLGKSLSFPRSTSISFSTWPL